MGGRDRSGVSAATTDVELVDQLAGVGVPHSDTDDVGRRVLDRPPRRARGSGHGCRVPENPGDDVLTDGGKQRRRRHAEASSSSTFHVVASVARSTTSTILPEPVDRGSTCHHHPPSGRIKVGRLEGEVMDDAGTGRDPIGRPCPVQRRGRLRRRVGRGGRRNGKQFGEARVLLQRADRRRRQRVGGARSASWSARLGLIARPLRRVVRPLRRVVGVLGFMISAALVDERTMGFCLDPHRLQPGRRRSRRPRRQHPGLTITRRLPPRQRHDHRRARQHQRHRAAKAGGHPPRCPHCARHHLTRPPSGQKEVPMALSPG